ncbi:MAG: glycoside hydrolase family 26 protein [Bacteroidota bacterium]
MKKLLIIAAIASIMFACAGGETGKSTQPSQKLFEQLKAIENNGVLFGHQDDLAYGVTWEYEEGRSDTYETAGDYPALFGWELGGIELGQEMNLDSVPFDKMRELAIKGHEMGGVLTFSWHPYSPLDESKDSWNTDEEVVKHILPGGSHHDVFKEHLDKVAAFLSSIKDEQGRQIPFIFRPWHEMDGDWFWWGSNLCTPEEFQEFFRFTIEYLRDEKDMDFLSAYSPDNRFNSEDEYLTWYPGDDVVEIIGVDNYGDFRQGSENIDAVTQKLEIVVDYARKTDKVAAFTETGLNKITDDKWFTQMLGKSILQSEKAREIAYVMLWRNDDTTHFFSAYPEHSSAPDFKEFTGNGKIWLLEDWNNFKTENDLE